MPTEKDYLQQAQALLPPGPAWTREPEANLTKLLSAFAEVFAAVDARAKYLADEVNPLNSLELLPDWERVCNLPDACTDYADKTIDERRNDVINRLNESASPTWAYFEQVARRLGYDISFMELRPFICGLSRCSDMLNGAGTVRYNFITIMIQGSRTAYFRAGVSRCGDRLGTIRRATELECIFNRIKPAHIQFIFSYE